MNSDLKVKLTPPTAELQVGMGAYATESPRCGGRIKASNEDFRVTEILNPEGLRGKEGPGTLPLYRVEKSGSDTFHVARQISRELGSRVSFAGVKDKRAETIQYLTPTSTRSRRPRMIEGHSFRAELVGFISRPFTRRMVLGNSFEVTLRAACTAVGERIEEAYRLCRERRIPNFFGLQRFGSGKPITHLIGRALVRGNFEEGIRYLLCEPRVGEGERVREARGMATEGMYAEALKEFTERQDLERAALGRLVKKADDFLGAFRALPIEMRRFFVHAYQSYVFNRCLTKAVFDSLDTSVAVAGDNWSLMNPDGLTTGEVHGTKEEPPGEAVPLVQLVGYSYRDYGSRFDRIVTEVLKDEGVAPREFYVKEAQEISAVGGFRRAPLTARDLIYRLSGENEAILSFALSRGEYATVLLREVLKPEDPFSAGF